MSDKLPIKIKHYASVSLNVIRTGLAESMLISMVMLSIVGGLAIWIYREGDAWILFSLFFGASLIILYAVLFDLYSLVASYFEKGSNSSSMMDIRFASKLDSEVLSALMLEASQSVKDSDFTPEGWKFLESGNTPQAFEKRFELTNYFCLVCEIDQELVGYLAMIDYEKIDHMFVLPKHRRKGVSAALWSKAKEVCAESGNDMYYWVRSSSYSEAVYQSFGFRPKDEKQSLNGISFQLMELGENES